MTARTSELALIPWIAALLVYSSAALAQDTSETRRAAALRYATVAPMSKLLDDSVSEMAKHLPEDQRAQFISGMRKGIRIDYLERAAIEAMVKTFTTQELSALADFFGSPVGQSAMNKFGIYMAEVMPAVQQEIIRAMGQK